MARTSRSSVKPYPFTHRSALITELRQRLEREDSPRLVMLALLTLAGSVAFLTSVLTLGAGLTSMTLRYALAVLAGYGAFLLFLRGWIALRRHEWPNLDLDGDIASDVIDAVAARLSPKAKAAEAFANSAFAGGRTGGGGGGSAWTHAGSQAIERTREESASLAESAAESLGSVDIDLDDFAWLLLAAATLGLGLICLSYVVYTAPLLLAEVALDAALVSTIYRRLRREEAGHWTGAVLRRTWLPAAGLTLFMAIAGFALEQAAPHAHSIGGVLRVLAS